MTTNEIHWEVTNKCNLRCKHCLPMSGSPRESELSTKEALAALQSFHATGITKIYFTGGEPFSRSDFWLLLEAAKELGIETTVITNGMYLKSPRDVCRLKGLCTHIGISLDGADEATNDSIRGEGVYAHVINVLSWCKAQQLPTTLYTTITRVNFTHVEALSLLAAVHNCTIHFNEVTINGRALSSEQDLKLTEAQQYALTYEVAEAAGKVFDETLGEPDSTCWVRNNVLYMSSDGNLYACSEVSQRHHEVPIGNIRSFILAEWMTDTNEADCVTRLHCCYSSTTSQHIVLIRDTGHTCAYVQIDGQISSLDELNHELDSLYENISSTCEVCEEADCMGYIWLINEEVDSLYEIGVPLVQVNNGPTFIHSFSTDQGGIPDLTTRYPKCSQLCDSERGCSIHEDRPFVCHLYPVGLETRSDGTVVWALHLGCLYVKKMQDDGTIRLFEHRARNIISRISPDLMSEILEVYVAVDKISSFPDGENNYSTLKEA